MDCSIAVVIITGGSGDASQSAEIFFLEEDGSTRTCPLSGLPDDRLYHSQDGTLLCGGGEETSQQISCLLFNETDGTWNKSHDLIHQRQYHSSWTITEGVMLLGGYSSGMESYPGNTTEIALFHGGSMARFPLDYAIR